MKQLKKVKFFEADSYESTFPPVNLSEFAAWIDEVTKQVPLEFRPSAEIHIDTDVDTSNINVKLIYHILETDEEETARVSQQERIELFYIEQDLLKLAQLKSKYEK